jgi:putative effector of murein hydrolase LrgA (UPF0299 family)
MANAVGNALLMYALTLLFVPYVIAIKPCCQDGLRASLASTMTMMLSVASGHRRIAS